MIYAIMLISYKFINKHIFQLNVTDGVATTHNNPMRC